MLQRLQRRAAAPAWGARCCASVGAAPSVLAPGVVRALQDATGFPEQLWSVLSLAGALAHRADMTTEQLPPGVVEFRRAYQAVATAGSEVREDLLRLQEADALLRGDDPEMAELAKEETVTVAQSIKERHHDACKHALSGLLMHAEHPLANCQEWTMEVSGRAGGVEASLFAGELFLTYQAYAEERGWQFRPLSDEGDAGGQCAIIRGDDVFQAMMHEIGVHRVQRVPVTEAAGRLQTSTAVVTMLPESAKPSVSVTEADCDIDMARGSGPGGQGVNSSSNAVRLKHRASGIVVHCHESRSAQENRIIAVRKVEQKLWKEEMKKVADSQASILASQWVSGERSERIRTYNFPQGRVTDHRAKKWSCTTITAFMDSAVGLQELHGELHQAHTAKQLPTAAARTMEDMIQLCRPILGQHAEGDAAWPSIAAHVVSDAS